MKKIAVWWVAFLAAFCMGSWVASAHANLLNMDPHDGQVVERSPDTISLDFSEPLEPDLIDLKLYNSDARQVLLERPRLSPGNAAQMYVKPPQLPAGTYTVVWSVVSEDGHPVTDSYAFSVGSVTPGGVVVGSDPSFAVKRGMLILIHGVLEAILLIAGGFSWFSWQAMRRGFPHFRPRLGPWRWFCWGLLLAGLVLEWILYSAVLPGGGLTVLLLEGKWSLLGQSQFAVMILVQCMLLLLLALPHMKDSWYLLIWLLLAISPAVSGHAWSTLPLWLALVLRILHLAAVSLWLGALTYLGLGLRQTKQADQTIDKMELRPFFVRIAVGAVILLVLTGTGLLLIQTDWMSLLRHASNWGGLLFAKLALLAVMLVLAVIQTLSWRKNNLSRSYLRMEWTAGLLAVFVGVWMSQIAFPAPVKSYSSMLEASGVKAAVQIPQLKLGKQTIRIRFVDPARQPVRVRIGLKMEDMDMGVEEISASKEKNGSYQAALPFSMAGKWQIMITAYYQDESVLDWSSTVLVPEGGD